ncbi:hypothetical protein DFH07DRAFT_906176 [Mycena maculata]|uniref:Uncharacterized protein n=1 Tax=Mycena maculata TaxID=230809 RepID=A0AAD7HYT0_9AGAR|nr:hypothetical protein DFH07DRAFT_906176 [Mycena maculata]
MARRRPPSNQNMGHSNMPTEFPKLSKSRHRPQPSVEQPNLGMSPQSRYNHNLKVLRRRDPSIISIFDQFSHVCVYHHNGKTWEKNGFEGSMFLYERDSYPPYGFYILNRMGMDDYIQRLYPEDVTGIHGTYLMLRSYPDFTSRRLAQVLASHDEPPEKFSDAYLVPDLEKLLDGDKGRAHTVGLWMFPTDAREPMIDVMMRLHSYIKQNVPYPEQYRYGPNRPPPPNPHLRTTSPSPPPEPHMAPSGDNGLDQSFPSGSASELDKLFARLTTAVPPTASAHTALPGPSRPKAKSTSTMTVASLFAALGGADVQDLEVAEETPPPAPRSGIPLLNSIFASAEPAPSNPPPQPVIHSPTPTTSVLSPQILNHEVITTLLGLPPSRSASAASAPYSSSREGDNEYEEGRQGRAGSDGFSESSTVLDPEAEMDEELQAAGASAGRPLLSVPAPRGPAVNGKVNGKGRAHGDVTPRAPIPGSASVNGHKPARVPVLPSMSEASGSTATMRASQLEPVRVHASGPFATGAELWPGDDDAHAADADAGVPSEEGEIVELDFEDTSALSDPDAFREVMQRRRNPDGDTSASGGGRSRGKGKKKGKRERAAERVFQLIDPAFSRQQQRSAPSSRSASVSPSPPPVPHSAGGVRPPFAEIETPATARPSKVQVAMNGSGSSSRGGGVGLDPGAARDSLIATLVAEAPSIPSIERNAFVREVLTLIHTDKAFVDALWRDYLDRTG